MKSNLLYLGVQSIIRFNLLMSDTIISASPGRLGAFNMLILFRKVLYYFPLSPHDFCIIHDYSSHFSRILISREKREILSHFSRETRKKREKFPTL